MSKLIKMTHRDQAGGANVMPEHVEAWEAKGWRKAEPVKTQPKQNATAKGQNND